MARQLHRYSSTTSFPPSFVSATFILIVVVAAYPLTFQYGSFLFVLLVVVVVMLKMNNNMMVVVPIVNWLNVVDDDL